MKKLLLLALIMTFVILSPSHVDAQTRVLVGIEGAQAFDNGSVGLHLGLEVPFLKRYELDLKDTSSPIETHVSLGGGRANIASVGGIVWLTKSWGLNGSVEDSS